MVVVVEALADSCWCVLDVGSSRRARNHFTATKPLLRENLLVAHTASRSVLSQLRKCLLLHHHFDICCLNKLFPRQPRFDWTIPLTGISPALSMRELCIYDGRRQRHRTRSLSGAVCSSPRRLGEERYLPEVQVSHPRLYTSLTTGRNEVLAPSITGDLEWCVSVAVFPKLQSPSRLESSSYNIQTR